MNVYVALLRGINVGGSNLIKMSALKACFGAQAFVMLQLENDMQASRADGAHPGIGGCHIDNAPTASRLRGIDRACAQLAQWAATRWTATCGGPAGLLPVSRPSRGMPKLRCARDD